MGWPLEGPGVDYGFKLTPDNLTEREQAIRNFADQGYSPIIAAAAMALSSVSVIVNSLRLGRLKN